MALALAAFLSTLPLEKPEEGDELLPPLALARGLPPRAVCLEMLAVSDAAVQSADREREAGNPWAAEASHVLWGRRWAWQYAADARLPWRARRRALRDLIEDVGWGAVLRGQLPPPVPLEWHVEMP